MKAREVKENHFLVCDSKEGVFAQDATPSGGKRIAKNRNGTKQEMFQFACVALMYLVVALGVSGVCCCREKGRGKEYGEKGLELRVPSAHSVAAGRLLIRMKQ